MRTPTLDAYLAGFSDRCSDCGAHEATQPHRDDCRLGTAETSEWAIFRAALRKAARDDGSVHQADVRPLIRGRIEPKHIGTLYRRARTEGLLREIDHERSDDLAGRNAGRLEPVYELRSAA